jgi:hypothetical protein
MRLSLGLSSSGAVLPIFRGCSADLLAGGSVSSLVYRRRPVGPSVFKIEPLPQQTLSRDVLVIPWIQPSPIRPSDTSPQQGNPA